MSPSELPPGFMLPISFELTARPPEPVYLEGLPVQYIAGKGDVAIRASSIKVGDWKVYDISARGPLDVTMQLREPVLAELHLATAMAEVEALQGAPTREQATSIGLALAAWRLARG